MTAIVFDTGALIALERRDEFVIAVIEESVLFRIPIYVPAGVLAQAWRGSPRQHAISKLLKSAAVKVQPLDETSALQIGMLLAKTATSDVTDAHVVQVARSLGNAVIYTSDPDDLKTLAPGLKTVTV